MLERLICLFISAFFMSLPAYSIERETVVSEYRSRISAKGAGVWFTENAIYFSVEKKCFRQQKYSGTKESRAATSELLLQIAKHFQIELYSDNIKPQILWENITEQLLSLNKKNANQLNMSGVLVADEDIGNCTRRRVMAFDLDSYNTAKLAANKVDVKALKVQVLANAFTTNNKLFLSIYMRQMGLLESYIAYSLDSNNQLAPAIVSLTSTDTHQISVDNHKQQLSALIAGFKSENTCKFPCKLHKPIIEETIDVGGVITHLNQFNGMVLFSDTTQLQQNIANEYLDKAILNFNQGINPKQIYSDLSVSLLFNSNNVTALNMMGAIARTLKKPHAALNLHTRALMLEPHLSSTLVHIFKTYQQLQLPTQALRYSQFVSEHYAWLTPNTWAKNEIKRISKELI